MVGHDLSYSVFNFAPSNLNNHSMNELTFRILKAAVCAAASYFAGKAVDAAVKNGTKSA